MLVALTKPRGPILSKLQAVAYVAVMLIDLPLRWIVDFCDAAIGNRGYVALGSLVGAYLAAFGLIDAKATQEETRATAALSSFVTLVSSGNSASLVTAMKSLFGSTQTTEITNHPSLWTFWKWGETSFPNKQFLHNWAKSQFEICGKRPLVESLPTLNCTFYGFGRIELMGADLADADLHEVDLSHAELMHALLLGADLRSSNLSNVSLIEAFAIGANFESADLTGALLGGTDITLANVRYANLTGVDMRDAILQETIFDNAILTRAKLPPRLAGALLRGAILSDVDLSAVEYLKTVKLSGAKYNDQTKFPPGFDPKAAGMVLSK